MSVSNNTAERIVRNAWLARLVKRTIERADSTFPLHSITTPRQTLLQLQVLADTRDPLIDPHTGDVIQLPRWKGRPFVRVKIVKVFMMQERGKKKDFFGRKFRHASIEITGIDGVRIDRRGQTYRLDRLQILFADEGCAVLEYGR